MSNKTISQFVLEPFHFQNKNFRVAFKDGVDFYCVKDTCDILDLTNPSKAVSNLDDDERDTLTTSDGVGRKKDMLFVTLSGLFALIFQSRKPEAKKFRKWVTSVVLPSIMKRGYFGTLSPTEARLQKVQVRHLTRELKKEKDAFAFSLLFDQLKDYCNLLGMRIPDINLLGQDRFQPRIKGV